MNAEITRQTRRTVRNSNRCDLMLLMVAPRPPELVLVGGENRFVNGPVMEAPPVYSKSEAPPDYGEVVRPPAVAVVR
jgi:hypothetical protein